MTQPVNIAHHNHRRTPSSNLVLFNNSWSDSFDFTSRSPLLSSLHGVPVPAPGTSPSSANSVHAASANASGLSCSPATLSNFYNSYGGGYGLQHFADHHAKIPTFERDFCSNFTCCGLALSDLHELLSHFEEQHVVVSDDAQHSSQQQQQLQQHLQQHHHAQYALLQQHAQSALAQHAATGATGVAATPTTNVRRGVPPFAYLAAQQAQVSAHQQVQQHAPAPVQGGLRLDLLHLHNDASNLQSVSAEASPNSSVGPRTPEEFSHVQFAQQQAQAAQQAQGGAQTQGGNQSANTLYAAQWAQLQAQLSAQQQQAQQGQQGQNQQPQPAQASGMVSAAPSSSSSTPSVPSTYTVPSQQPTQAQQIPMHSAPTSGTASAASSPPPSAFGLTSVVMRRQSQQAQSQQHAQQMTSNGVQMTLPTIIPPSAPDMGLGAGAMGMGWGSGVSQYGVSAAPSTTYHNLNNTNFASHSHSHSSALANANAYNFGVFAAQRAPSISASSSSSGSSEEGSQSAGSPEGSSPPSSVGGGEEEKDVLMGFEPLEGDVGGVSTTAHSMTLPSHAMQQMNAGMRLNMGMSTMVEPVRCLPPALFSAPVTPSSVTPGATLVTPTAAVGGLSLSSPHPRRAGARGYFDGVDPLDTSGLVSAEGGELGEEDGEGEDGEGELFDDLDADAEGEPDDEYFHHLQHAALEVEEDVDAVPVPSKALFRKLSNGSKNASRNASRNGSRAGSPSGLKSRKGMSAPYAEASAARRKSSSASSSSSSSKKSGSSKSSKSSNGGNGNVAGGSGLSKLRALEAAALLDPQRVAERVAAAKELTYPSSGSLTSGSGSGGTSSGRGKGVGGSSSRGGNGGSGGANGGAFGKRGREKAHKCPFPGCTKSYLNPNGLKYHIAKGTCTVVRVAPPESDSALGTTTPASGSVPPSPLTPTSAEGAMDELEEREGGDGMEVEY